MKKGFTLIELLVTVAILLILMGLIVRIASIGSSENTENVRIMQQLENALSGYYAAFGSYPPVPVSGSRNIYQPVSLSGDADFDQAPVKLPFSDVRMRAQILAACRSQPIKTRFPFNSGGTDYIRRISEYAQEQVVKDIKDGRFDADGEEPMTKAEQQNLMQIFTRGFDTGSSAWGRLNQLATSSAGYTWGADDVYLLQTGLMAFLLPRYQLMLSFSKEPRGGANGNGSSLDLDNIKQWTYYNSLPCDPETGKPFESWRQVRDVICTGPAVWKIEILPTEIATLRWLPYLKGYVATPTEAAPCTFYGLDMNKYVDTSGQTKTRLEAAGYSQKNYHRMKDIIYSSSGGLAPGAGGQYVLDFVDFVDSGGLPNFFYYSPPPYQYCQVWHAGADGMTMPPWVDVETLNEEDRKLANGWTADDIVHLSRGN